MKRQTLSSHQPVDFAFTPENLVWAESCMARYPEGRFQSALVPILWRAQQQNGGWLSEAAIHTIGSLLKMAPIRVMEVATFYSMFNFEPVGTHFVQVCGTTPCLLRNASDLMDTCRGEIGPAGLVSEDGLFSWVEVECLGACVNAPVVQINDDYYEDLDSLGLEKILTSLRSGRKPGTGPQNGRIASAPIGGFSSLLNVPDRTDDARVDLKPRTDAQQPPGRSGPHEGHADKLQKISGVGPVLERKLHSLGIFHFRQIADWDEKNVKWVNSHLQFQGRIERECWIDQARVLSVGGETEFSRRKQFEDS